MIGKNKKFTHLECYNLEYEKLLYKEDNIYLEN